MAVGSLLLLAAPAAYAEPIRPGEESTFDLGILPASTPEVLKAAASAPYVAPARENCEGVAREIAELDAVLGPDADAPKKGGGGAGKFVGAAVKSLIPYRSVVRFVTGADRKAKERNEAAMAGWARRGYLKAVQANLGCPGATAAPSPPAVTTAARPPDSSSADGAPATSASTAVATETPSVPDIVVAHPALADPAISVTPRTPVALTGVTPPAPLAVDETLAR